MTDRTDHYAAAERMLDDANEWAAQAGELSPKASERACLAHAQVHALLAIHDTLAAADRYAANEERQREEAEPDPLDEDDHRDRLDKDGDIVRRKGHEEWAWPGIGFGLKGAGWSLRSINASDGPLTFAPEPPQEATGDDLSASEGESGAEEGGESDDAEEPLLCPACGEGIIDHPASDDACSQRRCRLTTTEVARALIEQAVEPLLCDECGHDLDDHFDQAGGGRV